MNWIALKEESQLDTIKQESDQQPVLIFKHSTRCSISATALNRLERAWKGEEMAAVKAYYLDLLSYRNISQKIASTFEVTHESPQILLISNGECVYHASHLEIAYPEVKSKAQSV